jgi:hypothetical protein
MNTLTFSPAGIADGATGEALHGCRGVMGYSSDMPELGKNDAFFFMHCPRHFLPAFHLP